MKNSITNWSKSWVWKSYRKLPLWGQFAAPAAGIIIFIALFQMFGWILKIGLLAAVVFGAVWFYRKMTESSSRRD